MEDPQRRAGRLILDIRGVELLCANEVLVEVETALPTTHDPSGLAETVRV
jgi:hypothetical protein